MKSTVTIPQDKKHRHLITIPKGVWQELGLSEGDILQIDVMKIGDKKGGIIHETYTSKSSAAGVHANGGMADGSVGE